MIQKATIPMTVRELARNEDNLRFDLAIQRNTVWTDEQKTLFIHSLLYGYPFPPVYALDENDDQLWFLDGKQRTTTVVSFVKDGWKLSKNMPIIKRWEGKGEEAEEKSYDFRGKYFSEFAVDEGGEYFQEIIQNTHFYITQMKGLTEEERDEMFYRLNNGSPLKAIELTRVLAGSDVMEFVQEINKNHFFATCVALTQSGRNRFVDEELVMQIMSLVEANQETIDNGKALEPVDLSGREIKKFAQSTRIKGVSDNIKAILRNTTAYLEQAFPVEGDTNLKKLHVPMLFMMAWKFAIPNNVEPIKFAGWAQKFLSSQKPSHRYAGACSAGSAKKDNVKTRLHAMEADYKRSIDDASDYVRPVPEIVDETKGKGKGKGKKDLENAVSTAEKQDQQEKNEQTQANADKQADPMWKDGDGSIQGTIDETPNATVDGVLEDPAENIAKDAQDIVDADQQANDIVGAKVDADSATSDVNTETQAQAPKDKSQRGKTQPVHA